MQKWLIMRRDWKQLFWGTVLEQSLNDERTGLFAFISDQKENIVMTGGSFTTSDDTDSVITAQPRKTSRMETGSRAKAIDAGRTIFDDAHCERDWANGLCQCKGDDKRHCKSMLSEFQTRSDSWSEDEMYSFFELIFNSRKYMWHPFNVFYQKILILQYKCILKLQ